MRNGLGIVYINVFALHNVELLINNILLQKLTSNRLQQQSSNASLTQGNIILLERKKLNPAKDKHLAEFKIGTYLSSCELMPQNKYFVKVENQHSI